MCYVPEEDRETFETFEGGSTEGTWDFTDGCFPAKPQNFSHG